MTTHKRSMNQFTLFYLYTQEQIEGCGLLLYVVVYKNLLPTRFLLNLSLRLKRVWDGLWCGMVESQCSVLITGFLSNLVSVGQNWSWEAALKFGALNSLIAHKVQPIILGCIYEKNRCSSFTTGLPKTHTWATLSFRV